MEMPAGRRRKACEINNWLLALTPIHIYTTTRHTIVLVKSLRVIFLSDAKFRLRNGCVWFVYWYMNMIYMLIYEDKYEKIKISS